jgi:hypothetical protein
MQSGRKGIGGIRDRNRDGRSALEHDGKLDRREIPAKPHAVVPLAVAVLEQDLVNEEASALRSGVRDSQVECTRAGEARPLRFDVQNRPRGRERWQGKHDDTRPCEEQLPEVPVDH